MDDFIARFSVATARRGDVTVVSPVGELDLATAPQLGRALAALRGQDAPLVIDLRGISFIDSSGLRAVIAAVEEARRSGARVGVVAGDERVREVFEMAGVLERLPLVDAP